MCVSARCVCVVWSHELSDVGSSYLGAVRGRRFRHCAKKEKGRFSRRNFCRNIGNSYSPIPTVQYRKFVPTTHQRSSIGLSRLSRPSRNDETLANLSFGLSSRMD